MRNKRQNKRAYFNLGQAMVEMVIISFATLLILLSLLHFGFMYNAKTVLNYATYEAARAGSLNYGSPEAMNYALARVLASLETSPAPDDNFYDILHYQTSQNNAIDMVNNPKFVCTQRISPSTNNGHWRDRAADPVTHKRLTNEQPYTSYIPNDHLVYRSAAPDDDGLSIQDANLLKIKVTYCHKIITPIIGITMKRLMLEDFAATDPDPLTDDWTVPTRGEFTKMCYREDRIPIVSQAVIRMQTPIRDYAFADDCS
jgi:hypothetical protein